MKGFTQYLGLLGVFAGLSSGVGFAAVITVEDPARVLGADAIDPTGAKSVGTNNAIGSTSQATLEGISTFGAIQSFGGFTGNSTLSNEYIFNNITDATLPDLRIVYTGAIIGGVVAVSNESFSTSASSSMRLPGTGLGAYGMSIQLGSWNGTALATGADLGVSAFGFTLTGRYGQVTSVTFTYYDAAGNTLSSQTAPDNTGAVDAGTASVYSGYQITSGQSAIARVEISVVPISETSNGLFALDDVGFTAMVPEPSSLLMAAGALPLLWVRRRKCAASGK